MKRFLSVFVAFFLSSACSEAAFENWGETALVNSLGGEGVALTFEPACMAYNPAGLGFLQKAIVQFGYCKLFNLADLESKDFYLAYPSRRLTYGLGGFIFGNKNYYKETILAFSLSYKIKKSFSLGANVKYMKVGFNFKYADLSTVGFDGGASFQVNQKLGLGLALRNFNQPHLKDGFEDIPFSWAVGAKLTPYDNFKLFFGFSKEKKFPARAHFGQEIRIMSNMFLRMGMASQPIRYGLGMGTDIKRISFDYSFLEHPVLGSTHRFGLSFNLKN